VIVDYHMHLRSEGRHLSHTVETVERWAEGAAARGIDEIGFTEHFYYFLEARPLLTVPYQIDHCHVPIEPYVEAVLEGKTRGLPVKLGVEVDYYPGREDEVRALLARHPWDFVLGSVHYLDGLALDSAPTLVAALGAEEAYRRYFETLSRAAESGLFNALAHPDLVKFHAGLLEWDRSAFVDVLDGVCLEVSSAGLHKPHGRIYPEPELLEVAHDAGVGITLASDAHEPDDVGRDLERAIEHAREAGYETVTVFESGRGRQEPLG
jgi:histidinol-phosphatase (PHP family)